MVDVDRTQRFIERARLIHGDRYDYSETQFVDDKSELWLICRKHGKFRLSQAGSHLYGKKCGCRKCSNERLFPEKPKVEKPKRIDKSFLVNCRGCQKEFRSRLNGKTFCSVDCRKAHSESDVCLRVFDCCVCGKRCEARRHIDFQGKWTCGLECQRVLAGRGSLGRRDWIAASARAKKEWISCKSKERLKKNKWICSVKSNFSKILQEQKPKSKWEARVNSAVAMLSKRHDPCSSTTELNQCYSWEERMHMELRNLNSKDTVLCKWKQKAKSVTRAIRRRRHLLKSKACTGVDTSKLDQ